MKAYLVQSGSTSMETAGVVDVPVPELRPGSVLVKMKAASFNYRDLMIVVGKYMGGPVEQDTILGSDGAGEVVEVGEGVTRFEKGDRVAGTFFEGLIDGPANPLKDAALGHVAPGVLSEYRVFNEDDLVTVPKNLNYEEAACLPCAALTAWHALMEAGPAIGKDDNVLLLGTGGVSTFALQFACALGAKAIVTSSSDEKLAKAKAMGASALINYKKTPDWEVEVKNIADGEGVKAVVEVGGIGTISKSMACLGMGGKIGMIGVLAGDEGACHPRSLMMTGSSIHGIFVGSRSMFERMNQTIEQHDIHPVIDKVFEFEQTSEALNYFQAQEHVGKVVVKIA